MRAWEKTVEDAGELYRFLSQQAPAPEKADLILALGSHDVEVADHAARLYLAGQAPRLVCTGGLGKMTGGVWSQPEAVVFAQRCEALGVPRSAILTEPRSTNTGENFTFTRALLEGMGLAPRTGVIVCKPYMALRAWATGTCQWSQVDWYVRAPEIAFEDYFGPQRPLERDLPVMVGDFQRLTVYAQKGYQAPVPVPDGLWDVYRRLVADGYDRFVIR